MPPNFLATSTYTSPTLRYKASLLRLMASPAPLLFVADGAALAAWLAAAPSDSGPLFRRLYKGDTVGTTESIDVLSQNSVANIQKATETLIAAGAKHLMVVGTTDLSHVPAVVQGNQIKNATEYQQRLEQKLPAVLTTLAKAHHVSISYFDHLAFSNKLRAAPDVAGLKDLDTPCQATYPDVKPVLNFPLCQSFVVAAFSPCPDQTACLSSSTNCACNAGSPQATTLPPF